MDVAKKNCHVKTGVPETRCEIKQVEPISRVCCCSSGESRTRRKA